MKNGTMIAKIEKASGDHYEIREGCYTHGYLIARDNDTFVTESPDPRNMYAATIFPTIRDAGEYLECSYPENGDWKGHWYRGTSGHG
jgi:hypothetical protein